MDRRNFLQGCALCAGALALPELAGASQSCGPVIPTPYGPIQRCTAGIEAFRFQTNYHSQEKDEWCWAACISMVFSYYDHPVRQPTIVSAIWGDAVDRPGAPEQILEALNRDWTDENGDSFESTGDVLSTNAFTAVKDLQADQPLIVGALGHAMVLTALTADSNVQTGQYQFVEAVVRDPWPTSGGRRVLTPLEWTNISFLARVRVK